MPLYLLVISAIILICVLLNKVSSKLGIPMLAAFIALGMLFGSDGLLKIQFENYASAEKICSIALIFIMFYGGFGTKWSEAKPVAVKSVILSTLGVILTAALVGLFCFLVMGFELLEGMLLGAVISSTDAASVFSILRSKRLNLKYNTASMLEVESGSNDPCSYMLTVLVISIMNGKADAGQIAYMLFSQLAYGAIFGVIIAYASVYVLRRFKFATGGFDAAFVLAIALLSYAAPAAVGGNGYLSAYIVGIILGNSNIKNKKSLIHFFDGMTGLTQMLIFFLLGLLSTPSQMPGILIYAFAIALFLTFVARPLSIFAILSPSRCKLNQQLLVSWSGLRGAASIVFAIMATLGRSYFNNDLFNIVFCIVLFSIAIQGSLLPVVARRLNMIDDEQNVMKTFTDYSDEVPIQFIKLSITESHPWAGKCIRDIALVPDTLLVLIMRGSERIVPKGSTAIMSGDILVMSAHSFGGGVESEDGLNLSEIIVEKKSELLGRRISDLKHDDDRLIIMIKRGDKIVIPTGKTVLKEKDILVISQT